MTAGCLKSLLVYATTAANPTESSYACYYDEKRSTYLGDWYSVNWMEDSDVVSPQGSGCTAEARPSALMVRGLPWFPLCRRI